MSDELEKAKADQDWEQVAQIKAKLLRRDRPTAEKAVEKH